MNLVAQGEADFVCMSTRLTTFSFFQKKKKKKD
jgi:hypothetical protein